MRNRSNEVKDPIYQNKTGLNSVGESMEGFRSSSHDVGMKNMDKTDGFGAQFQMPDPQTNDGYLNQHSAQPNPLTTGDFDIHAGLEAISDLSQRLRASLMGPEQDELEQLLREGAALLSQNWKALSGGTTQQFATVKDELKENPYKGLMAAIRVGMALSQIVASRRTLSADMETNQNVVPSPS